MVTATSQFEPSYFSTDQCAERDRVEVWRATYGRGMDVLPLANAPFASSLTLQSLPGLGIVFGTSSPARYERARTQPMAEDLTLMVHLEGKATISQRGRELTFGDGEAALLSGEEIGGAVVPEGLSYLTLRLPGPMLRPMIVDVDGELVRRIRRENPFLRLLVRYIAALQEPGLTATPDLCRLAVTHVYDLVATTIGAAWEACEIAHGRGVRAGQLSVIKSYVDKNFADPSLSAPSVAAKHGFSARYLHMLFQPQGISFGQYVLEKRLACAHRMLGDRRFGDRAIARIALDVGFGDLSYFNRTFRRRYGSSPSDVRNDAAQL